MKHICFAEVGRDIAIGMTRTVIFERDGRPVDLQRAIGCENIFWNAAWAERQEIIIPILDALDLLEVLTRVFLRNDLGTGRVQPLIAVGMIEMPVRVDEMRHRIGTKAVDDWMQRAFDTKRKLMGFGHRVYKAGDHRAPILHGLGRKLGVDLDKFLDTSKSLNEGAILYPEYAVDSWGWNILTESGLFDLDKKLADFTPEEMDRAARFADIIARLVDAYELGVLIESVFDRAVKTTSSSTEMRSDLREWLGSVDAPPEHRELLMLTICLTEIVSRGEAEREMCRDLLETILRFSERRSASSSSYFNF